MSSPGTMRSMVNLLKFELRKLVKQKLLITGSAIIAFFTFLSSLGFIMHRLKKAEKSFQGELMGELLNGITFSMSCLVPAVYVILPMVVAIFTAGNFAGEMQNGQLRTTLLRPVSRWNIYLAKFISMSIFSFFLLLVLLLLSYASGAIMFGPTGDIIVMGKLFLGRKTMFILNNSVAWKRMLLIYSLSGFSMIYLVAMYMMVAAVVKKASHTIVISLGIYYTSYILMSISFMKYLHSYLPTRYLAVWRFAVLDKIPWDRVGHDVLIDLGYIVSFLIIGIIFFNMSDA